MEFKQGLSISFNLLTEVSVITGFLFWVGSTAVHYTLVIFLMSEMNVNWSASS